MAFDGEVPDIRVYGPRMLFLLALFGVFDFLVARHTKARWFAIHVLANSIVTACSLPGVLRLLQHPARAMLTSEFSPFGVSANICIHMYHILAFRDLTWLDWLHHGVMTGVLPCFFVGILVPITLFYNEFYGPTADTMNFFACGLPGGMDYAMLFAVKHGWMTSLKEKQINTTINTWLRAPGIVFTSGLVFVQYFLKDPTATWLEFAFFYEMLILVLFVWNAQFFLARVVGNYHVRKHQEEQKKQTPVAANGHE